MSDGRDNLSDIEKQHPASYDEVKGVKKQIADQLGVPAFTPAPSPINKAGVGLNRQRHQEASTADMDMRDKYPGYQVEAHAYEREKLLVDSDVLKSLSDMLMHDLSSGGNFDRCCEGGESINLNQYEQLAKAILRRLHAAGIFPTIMINGKPTIMVTRGTFVTED